MKFTQRIILLPLVAIGCFCVFSGIASAQSILPDWRNFECRANIPQVNVVFEFESFDGLRPAINEPALTEIIRVYQMLRVPIMLRVGINANELHEPPSDLALLRLETIQKILLVRGIRGNQIWYGGVLSGDIGAVGTIDIGYLEARCLNVFLQHQKQVLEMICVSSGNLDLNVECRNLLSQLFLNPGDRR